MTQVIDRQHCDVPDYFIHTVTTCACGDDPVQIPLDRRTSSNHWCTGTLKMLDNFGTTIYVYNQYTFEQLRSMLDQGRMDAYLTCISRLSQVRIVCVFDFFFKSIANAIYQLLIFEQKKTYVKVHCQCHIPTLNFRTKKNICKSPLPMRYTNS
jgi:hypothetical protein